MNNRSLPLTIMGIGMVLIYGIGTLVFFSRYIVSYLNPNQIILSDFYVGQFKSIEDFRIYTMLWILYLPAFIAFIGVLRLKEWGRELAVFTSILMCLFFVWRVVLTHGGDGLAVASLFVNVAVILFLMRPVIKEQFLFGAPPTGKCVLVIDDDRGFLKMVYSFLLSRGHSVILAENGEKGIKLAKKKKPDLILLDVIMPKMKGREVCAHLKEDEETKDIPVIFLTAKDSPDDIRAEMELGALTHITKPFNSQELFSKIAGILDSD